MEDKIRKRVQEYANAYILYEIATRGIDPRNTLEGTILRNAQEGYKYDIYEKFHPTAPLNSSYVDFILGVLPKSNLASYHQKKSIEDAIKAKGSDKLEKALKLLYEGNDDRTAFNDIVDVIGARFDVLGLIFFLKDCEVYLPIRPSRFDEKFKAIGLKTSFSGHCNWDSYKEYNSLIDEIKLILNSVINNKITLLDAHSFVWIISGLAAYLNQEVQAVEHEQFGRGTIVGFEDDMVRVRFNKLIVPEEFKPIDKELAFNKDKLKIIPNNFDVYLGNNNQDGDEFAETSMGPIYEGAKKQVVVNAYERDPKAVRTCKDYYLKNNGRLTCQVCGFDFGEFYGPEYDNKIHIHHKKPLNEIGEEYKVDPIEDLIPVCPNCHMVLHSNGGITIEALKEKLSQKKN